MRRKVILLHLDTPKSPAQEWILLLKWDYAKRVAGLKPNPGCLALSRVSFFIIIAQHKSSPPITCKDIHLVCAARRRSSMDIDWLFQCSWHCSPWEAKGNEEDPEPDLEPAAAQPCTSPCIFQVTPGKARRWIHAAMLPPCSHPHTHLVQLCRIFSCFLWITLTKYCYK